jgi:uncharacterized membrane protein
MKKAIAALALAFSLTGCATMQEVASSKETFVACQALDTVTTYVAIQKLGFVEGNPLMAALLKHGWLPFIGFKVTLIYIVYNANLSPPAQTAANVVACVPGVWNATLIVGQ